MTAPSDLKVKGKTTWIGIDGQIAGAIVIQDELREYAEGLGQALHNLGVKRIELATGDNEESEARRVAQLIGVDGYRWGLKPEDKTAIVKDLSSQAPTVMVGDGDAAAEWRCVLKGPSHGGLNVLMLEGWLEVFSLDLIPPAERPSHLPANGSGRG